MGRANQKTVKLTKEQEKLRKMQDRLSQLTKQYRVHFGEDLKTKKKEEKLKVKEEKKKDNQEDIEEFADFVDE